MTGRDRFVDVVRAYAVVGVVLGHWLVTGLVLGADGALRQASPLSALPGLAPVTWVLQTLGLFFFAGGFAAARSLSGDRDYRGWLGRRLGRLPRPVGLLLGAWAIALVVAAALGAPAATLRTVGLLAVSPLWFLLPYVVLTVLTGVLRKAGWYAIAAAVLVVTLGDAGLLSSSVQVPVRVLAAWLIPWALGIAAADGRLRRPVLLLVAGGLLMTVVIGLADYPVSAVGVPGDGRSNLSPPSLFAVGLAAAQIGTALLLRHRLVRRPENGRAEKGRAVTVLNRLALPIFLGHQSVLLLVAVTAARLRPASPVPGLLTRPADLLWVAYRAAWLPVLTLVLAAGLWIIVARATPGAARAAVPGRQAVRFSTVEVRSNRGR